MVKVQALVRVTARDMVRALGVEVALVKDQATVKAWAVETKSANLA